MFSYHLNNYEDQYNLYHYLDDMKTNTREIKVNNYIKHHIHTQKNGHDTLIVTGDEKNLDNVVVQKFKCRWPKNRNPRKKGFTHG